MSHGYYGKIVQMCGQIAEPLIEQLKKGYYLWDEKVEKAFYCWKLPWLGYLL